MRSDVRNDWDFGNLHLPEAFNILRFNASFLVSFEIASENIDLKEVGDIVLSSNMGHIAFRVRRSNVAYRDLTIRAKRASGVETEIHKIRNGFGRWYLYAWSDDDKGKIKDWLLIDLDEFRKCGLAFQERHPIPNKDNDRTWFYAYSDRELELHNCLVAKHNDRLEKTKPIPPTKPVQLKLMDEMYLEALKHDAFHQPYYKD